jgi:hypothetical protein
MGQKRHSYKRRIKKEDRIKREALRILPTLCPAEHLQALAQLDQAIKNGQAKWPQEADTGATHPQGESGKQNGEQTPHRAQEDQHDPRKGIF